MPGWLKQVLISVGGLVLVLAWWTIRGPGEDKTERVEKIPAKVWDGTLGPLEVRAKVNQPAEITMTFERQKAGASEGDHEMLEARQPLAAGEHSFSVQVPPKTYGRVEVQIHDPQVGASFAWVVLVGGRVIYEHTDTLEKPLEQGYAFFDNVELDDVAATEPFARSDEAQYDEAGAED